MKNNNIQLYIFEVRSKLVKVRKLSIDFFTYKTILYIAGGIIRGNKIFFDILTKTSERMCMHFNIMI